MLFLRNRIQQDLTFKFTGRTRADERFCGEKSRGRGHNHARAVTHERLWSSSGETGKVGMEGAHI